MTLPDRSQRQQTRSATLGLGADRRVPFGAELRGQRVSKAGKDLYHLNGYATMFDRSYPMWDMFGEYDEVVVGGAADRTLSREPDVAFLVNHGGVTMARTTNGTLELSANKTGLVSDAWVNPERTDVQILMSAVNDRLITEMSFAFMIPEGRGQWSEDFTRFEIHEFDINRGDVSGVNYGANPHTSIAARAREIMTHAEMLPPGMQRALATKLGSFVDRRTRQLAEDIEHDTAPLAAPLIPARPAIPAGQGRSLSVIETLLRED